MNDVILQIFQQNEKYFVGVSILALLTFAMVLIFGLGKEDTSREEDNGGEVVFIFKFIVKAFRLLIVVSALVLACVMLSRFLL